MIQKRVEAQACLDRAKALIAEGEFPKASSEIKRALDLVDSLRTDRATPSAP